MSERDMEKAWYAIETFFDNGMKRLDKVAEESPSSICQAWTDIQELWKTMSQEVETLLNTQKVLEDRNKNLGGM